MNSHLFDQIRVEDLSKKVYDRLKQAITTGIIKPGERIDMNVLSEQWGVSKTPMKDAITRLTSEGLVVVKPKVGTYATQFTGTDMMELFHIRFLLEGAISEDIIRHIEERQMLELEQTFTLLETELAKSKDEFNFFVFNDLDASFHEQLVQASGNRKLLEVYRSLNFHTQVARYFFDNYEQRAELSQLDHREMLRAINNQDAAKLAVVMKQHIVSGQERLREFSKSN